MSHPTWVRGLKLYHQMYIRHRAVAPYVGAWIETHNEFTDKAFGFVAPYVGAWIETFVYELRSTKV